MSAPVTSAAGQGAAFWRTVKAVSWSFVGIRQDSEFKKDLAQVNPVHVIVIGIVSALLFVAGLIVLVNWVVR